MKAIYTGIIFLFMTSLASGQNSWTIWSTFDEAPRDFDFKGPTGYLIENDGGVTANGDVLKTTDNGGTWMAIDDPDGGAGYLPKAIDLYFETANIGYQITGNGRVSSTDLKLFKTTDGGSNWTFLSQLSTVEFFHGRMIQMSDTLSVVIGAASAFAAPVVISTDNNQTWSTLAVPTSPFGKVADARFFSSTEGIILREKGVEDAEILRTTDGGLNWQVVYTLDLPVGNIPAARPSRLYFPTSQVGYAITAFESINNDTTHNLAKTLDGGQTWTDLPPIPMAYSVNGQNVVIDDWFLSEVHFLDENRGFIVGQDYSLSFGKIGFILRTEDGGMSWSMDLMPQSLHDASKDNEGNAPAVLNIQWLDMDRAFALYNQHLIRWGAGSGTTNVEGSMSRPAFRMYPNPTSNLLQIHIPDGLSLDLSIWDTKGNRLLELNRAEDGTEWDLGHLSEGLYVVLCSDQHGRATSRSLIIRR